MELFFKYCIRFAYFCLTIMLVCMGTKNICLAAKSSVKYDDAIEASKVNHVVCTPKSITVSGYLSMQKQALPTGAEIYRTRIKTDGTKGSFKKIGICEKFTQGKWDKTKWKFTYKDSAVKTGQAYIYKFRGYRKSRKMMGFQKKNFAAREAVAAKKTGKYTCKVIENSPTSLVLKVKGVNKNNGPLEGYVDDAHSHSVFLVCKNKEQQEILKSIAPEAYSYDGKEWHNAQSFTVKGGQCIYLRFSGEDIEVANYRSVQMIMGYMRYNLCPWNSSDAAMPQVRFNLVSRKASTGNFIVWNSDKEKWMTKWEKGEFTYTIPVGKDTDVLYCRLEYGVDCSIGGITIRGWIRNDCKGYLDTTGADIFPAGVDIYRAEVKENGENDIFLKIGVIRGFEYREYDDHDEWTFTYTDNEITTGQSYAYMVKPFIETENTRKFQKDVSDIKQGVAANGTGKYSCEIIENTSDSFIVKITGKDKNNGPLVYKQETIQTTIVYKNEGETQNNASISVEAYSYDGKKWFKGEASVSGKEVLYLRFHCTKKKNIKNLSDYQFIQMIMPYVNYNLAYSGMRLNLTTGEALTGDFTAWDQEEECYWFVWDGNLFTPVYAGDGDLFTFID